MVLEDPISEAMQELDEVRLTQQKIEEERERLVRKRPRKEAEKERVTRQLEQLHEKSQWLQNEKRMLELELHNQRAAASILNMR